MKYDDAIELVADYICTATLHSDEAYVNARACLADALGCAILALKFKACTKLLGAVLPGTVVPNGCRVPGTSFVLDPIRAAFNIGIMIRWLDFNDAWLAAEWGHPSDNFGGILAVGDYQSRNTNLTIKDILTAAIKAYEIQGGLALLNSFNRIGFDHTILVKVATAGVVTHLLGGSKEHICAALSNAWLDTGPLRTYRHGADTGSRKSWAAGDATSRGVQLAWWVLQGEMGYPRALTAPKWGFYDVLYHGEPFKFQRPLGSYVMENILYKISYPAEFHAQTAVECAIELHPFVKGKWDEIDTIDIITHNSAIRIIDKIGPLKNPADRDHCLQYMTAIGLIKGHLTAEDYEDETARDPLIESLRDKMTVKEDKQYSLDYHDPEKRSIPNALTIRMKDGTVFGPLEKHYPIGHRRRREEGLPLLYDKFFNNLLTHYDRHQSLDLLDLFKNPTKLMSLKVHHFIDCLL